MLVVGNSDCQVSRAPEQVHQGKRDDHLQTVIAIGGHEDERAAAQVSLPRIVSGVALGGRLLVLLA